MKFSVLMSVYGKDDVNFFRTSLESVTVQQTLKPAQVVIVQDGPVPEGVDQVIDALRAQLSDITFTVLKKQVNAGLAAALNSGLSLCEHEWIARMDSDDIAFPDRFEKQFGHLEKHPQLDVIGGFVEEFMDQIGDVHSVRAVPLENDDIYQMAKTRNPINHPTVVYRKSAVEQVGGYCEDFGKLEDYKLWVDMMTAQKQFANLSDTLLHFRVGNGFIERRSSKREIYDWDMLQKYLLQNRFIGKGRALKNRIYIRAFIYMPAWMKKLAYKILLRK